jgi:formate/nitrite transporter FocA (FNT family)
LATSDLQTTQEDQPDSEETPRKPLRQIMEQEITEGLSIMRRSTFGLIVSGLSAGLDLGFSVFLMTVVLSSTRDVFSKPAVNLLVAAAYSIGFIFVILGRSELFTEHTTLAILPVLNGNASLRELARLWGFIYWANIAGGAIIAVMIVALAPALGDVQVTVFGVIAGDLVRHPWWVILLSGVMAGWLMGLVSWLVTASRDSISQIAIIGIITTTIGLLHLHHSMAGSIEVLVGLFSHQGISLPDYFTFLVWATIGNSIGGVFFVGVIKYGNVILSPRNHEKVKLKSPDKEEPIP